ncbi:MAG: EthD family reductase [Proteobacteria bacterium]|nr:MAG: EthD family reductase [Pseudomonadota bacterium]
MINVSVWYPNGVGVRFDMDYYVNSHIPMVRKLLEPALRKAVIEQPLSAVSPGPEPAFVAGCQLHFDSVEAFQAAFEPHAAAIQDDIANYTNTTPVIQINELK